MGLGSDEGRFGPRSVTARERACGASWAFSLSHRRTHARVMTRHTEISGPPQSAASVSAVLSSVTAAAVSCCRLLRCPFEASAPIHVGGVA